MQLMWMEFAFDAHQVNANSIRIQTELKCEKALSLER